MTKAIKMNLRSFARALSFLASPDLLALSQTSRQLYEKILLHTLRSNSPKYDAIATEILLARLYHPVSDKKLLKTLNSVSRDPHRTTTLMLLAAHFIYLSDRPQETPYWKYDNTLPHPNNLYAYHAPNEQMTTLIVLQASPLCLNTFLRDLAAYYKNPNPNCLNKASTIASAILSYREQAINPEHIKDLIATLTHPDSRLNPGKLLLTLFNYMQNKPSLIEQRNKIIALANNSFWHPSGENTGKLEITLAAQILLKDNKEKVLLEISDYLRNRLDHFLKKNTRVNMTNYPSLLGLLFKNNAFEKIKQLLTDLLTALWGKHIPREKHNILSTIKDHLNHDAIPDTVLQDVTQELLKFIEENPIVKGYLSDEEHTSTIPHTTKVTLIQLLTIFKAVSPRLKQSVTLHKISSFIQQVLSKNNLRSSYDAHQIFTICLPTFATLALKLSEPRLFEKIIDSIYTWKYAIPKKILEATRDALNRYNPPNHQEKEYLMEYLAKKILLPKSETEISCNTALLPTVHPSHLDQKIIKQRLDDQINAFKRNTIDRKDPLMHNLFIKTGIEALQLKRDKAQACKDLIESNSSTYKKYAYWIVFSLRLSSPPITLPTSQEIISLIQLPTIETIENFDILLLEKTVHLLLASECKHLMLPLLRCATNHSHNKIAGKVFISLRNAFLHMSYSEYQAFINNTRKPYDFERRTNPMHRALLELAHHARAPISRGEHEAALTIQSCYRRYFSKPATHSTEEKIDTFEELIAYLANPSNWNPRSIQPFGAMFRITFKDLRHRLKKDYLHERNALYRPFLKQYETLTSDKEASLAHRELSPETYKKTVMKKRWGPFIGICLGLSGSCVWASLPTLISLPDWGILVNSIVVSIALLSLLISGAIHLHSGLKHEKAIKPYEKYLKNANNRNAVETNKNLKFFNTNHPFHPGNGNEDAEVMLAIRNPETNPAFLKPAR